MKWFHRHMDDTQPLPAISTNQIEAMKALQKVRQNKKDAVDRNIAALEAAEELRDRCKDNHFTDGWLQMLKARTHGGRA